MKKDNSPKGSIDRDILPLLNKINSNACYQTTSSCSGRIVLISSLEKGKAKWLFKSHSPVSASRLWNALQNTEGTVWLLQEPMILHVRCDSMESANRLIGIANKAGLKAAELSAKTFTVEIRGNERIEAPVEKKAVSREYAALLAKEANKKLKMTKAKINRLITYF